MWNVVWFGVVHTEQTSEMGKTWRISDDDASICAGAGR